MFVTATDFDVKPYNLIGLAETVAEGELTTFERFRNEQEEEVLVKLLGRYFYDALAAGVTALPSAYVAATSYAIGDKATYGGKVWTSLTAANIGNTPVEGANWTEDVAQKRWLDIRDGATFTNNANRVYKWDGMGAAIRPYIYSAWLLADLGQASSSGLVNRAHTENGNTVLPDREIVKGFNDYSNRVAGTFPQMDERDTLYGFLFYSGTTYDADVAGGGYGSFFEYLNECFDAPGHKNIFNI